MSTGQQQPHPLGQGLDGAAGNPVDRTLLQPYTLEPPEWRASLLANKNPALYPDFFPGATALYPQLATQSAGHVPGVSRDSSAAASGSHFTPVAGVTASKEDELNETVAKLGFVNRAVVQTENFSAHALIHNKLHNGPSIHALGKIIQRVLERRNSDDSLLPNPGPWTYKAPSRVVYNASRLESWYADLANPSVPLSKLAKNIPSAPSTSSQSVTCTGTGTYGGSPSVSAPSAGGSKLSGSALDRNLDMLITRQVPLHRALWFLQAVGQNDITQLSKSKNLQVHPILSYSADFTVAVVESLKRQIAEAVLPLTQAAGASRLLPGMSVKGRPRNILAEEHGKDRWMAKWKYTLTLLPASLDESMLDRQQLCSLLLQNLQPQTRIQMLWWLAVILQTSIDDMLGTAWMSKALVIILVDWLKSIEETFSEEDGSSPICKEIGQSLLRHVWLTDSDMFLIPQLWTKRTDVAQLRSMLAIGADESVPDEHALWQDLEERANVLLCRGPPRNDTLKTLQELEFATKSFTEQSSIFAQWTIDAPGVIRVLDRWEDTDSIIKLTAQLLQAPDRFTSPVAATSQETGDHKGSQVGLHPEVLKILLMWATTTTRRGAHRPFLSASVLRHYVGLPYRHVGQPHGSGDATPDDALDLNMDRFEELQNYIMEWIDCQENILSKQAQTEIAVQWTSYEATLSMCQILLSQGILELSGLVQKVIARGHADADLADSNGIYSQILQGYGGHSERLALRWQMARVSVSGNPSIDDDPSASIKEGCRRELQPLLQRLENDDGSRLASSPSLDLQAITATLLSFPVMRRAWTISAFVVPLLCNALQSNSLRQIDISTALSLLGLLETLKAYEAEAYFMNTVLQDFTATPELIEAIVSVHRVNREVFAALGGLGNYASSLFTACQNLGDQHKPDTFVLAEVAALGLNGHLSQPQLHKVRRKMRTWQREPVLPALLPSMLSPPDHDSDGRDTSSQVLECLNNFCHLYTRSPETPQIFENVLVNLLSVVGSPLDFTGNILPAMLHLLSEAHQEHGITAAMRALCLAIVDMPIPLSAKPRIISLEERSPFLPKTFTDVHTDFLKNLIVDNIVSVDQILQFVCSPLLEGCLRSSIKSNQTMPALLNLLADLLLGSGGVDYRAWRLAAARVDLYRPQFFADLYRVVQQLSDMALSEHTAAWQSQLYEIHHGVLAQASFQKAFVRRLQDADNESVAIKSLNSIEYRVVWDALSILLIPWFERPDTATLTRGRPTSESASAIQLLNGGLYSPFVSTTARWYLKSLLARLGPPSITPSSTSAPLEPTARRFFVHQCLQHCLKSPETEASESLAMFTKYLGGDLISIAFEALANDFESYGLKLSAASDVGIPESGWTALGRVIRLTGVTAQICSTVKLSPDAPDESILGRIIQTAATILATLTYKRQQPKPYPHVHAQVGLVSHIVCLARASTDPTSLGPKVMASFASSLAEYLSRIKSDSLDDQYLRDVLGWLLQSMPASNRYHILNPYQRLSICFDSSVGYVEGDFRKLFSLGPPAPLECLALEDSRFFTLRRTWTGLSAIGNTNCGVDVKCNNEPVDLLKYHCRTSAIERQLQPAYRSEEMGSWKSFDSETPWDRGTSFQRDFRRSTITQPEFLSTGQAHALRNRATSQLETRPSQGKGTTLSSGDSNKQSGKEETVDAHTREPGRKKRKAVPEVIVIEEISPKKKSRTTGNSTSGVHAAKQSKQK